MNVGFQRFMRNVFFLLPILVLLVTATSRLTPTPAPQPASLQNGGWQLYKNTVIGYQFEYPISWAIPKHGYGSERNIEIQSCAPSNADCPGPGLQFQVGGNAPDNSHIPAEWTKSAMTIDGVTAEKVFAPVDNTSITSVYFNKDGKQYYLQLFQGNDQLQQVQPIFDHILSSFRFITPQTPQPPPAYRLLKNISVWDLTYQDTRQRLACSDGRTGNIASKYVFDMNTQGDTNNHTKPGDIDIPYAQVICLLNNNGWQQCKAIGSTELSDTSGTSEIFVKNNNLIGVYRHYSMGVGNWLTVVMQYEK